MNFIYYYAYYIHHTFHDLDIVVLFFVTLLSPSTVTVFSEQIVGSKRWFLYPPSHSIHFDPNMTIHHWVKQRETILDDQCTTEKNESLLYEGTVVPGEILYLPAGWLHATYNLLSLDNYNIFMSLFIDPQLLKT